MKKAYWRIWVIIFLPFIVSTTAILAVIRNQYSDLTCEALYSYTFLLSKQDTYGYSWTNYSSKPYAVYE